MRPSESSRWETGEGEKGGKGEDRVQASRNSAGEGEDMKKKRHRSLTTGTQSSQEKGLIMERRNEKDEEESDRPSRMAPTLEVCFYLSKQERSC